MSDSSKTAPLDSYARFLTARWDEEEAAARETIAERGRIKFVNPRDNGPDWCFDANPDAPVPVVSVGPERVLADLAAKREVLGMARQGMSEYSTWAFERILHALAAPFRDHPDHPANTRLADISPEHAARIRARTDIKPLRLDHPANREA